MRPAPRGTPPALNLEVPRPARQYQAVMAVAALLVAIVCLQRLGGFLAPVLFGAMVAGASAPLVAWLNRRRVPVVVSAATVLLLDFAALASLGWLLLTSAGNLQERLPRYIQRLFAVTTGLTHHFGNATAALHDKLESDRISNTVASIAERLVGITSFAAVVAFVVFFTLCEGKDIGQRLRVLQPGFAAKLDRLERVMADVRSYLLVKSFTSLLAAAATWLVVDAFDLPLAPLLALGMFVLHFVPNIGAAVATLAAMGVAVAERGTGTAVAVGSALATVSLVLGSVLEPQFLGRALRLSPLMVLLGMMFWGFLWGPVGALLSVPLMVVVKAALENSELSWVGQLLGNRAPEAVVEPRRRPVLVLRRRAVTPVPGQNAS